MALHRDPKEGGIRSIALGVPLCIAFIAVPLSPHDLQPMVIRQTVQHNMRAGETLELGRTGLCDKRTASSFTVFINFNMDKYLTCNQLSLFRRLLSSAYLVMGIAANRFHSVCYSAKRKFTGDRYNNPIYDKRAHLAGSGDDSPSADRLARMGTRTEKMVGRVSLPIVSGGRAISQRSSGPVRSVPQETAIYRPAVSLATKILSGKNTCSDYFNSAALFSNRDQTGKPTQNAALALSSDRFIVEVMINQQSRKTTPNIGASAPQNGGFGSYFTINMDPNGMFLATNHWALGGIFPSGRLAGQTTQILHELAHTLGLVGPDYDDAAKSEANTQEIVGKCAVDILASINGFE